MILGRQLLNGILAASLLILIGFGGCARVTIHPLDNDFLLVKKGESMVAPKDGAFLSDFYIEQVMEARVDA